MKRTRYFLTLFLVLCILVTGCQFGGGGGGDGKGTDTGDGKGTDGKGGPLPPCTGEVLEPIPAAPGHLAVIDTLTPTFAWAYPDITCAPDRYDIWVQQGPAYDVAAWSGTVTGAWNTWTPDTPLEPGSVYSWHVQAWIGDTPGPVSYGKFFTGPECALSDLSIPVLTFPAEGATLTGSVDLMWENLSPCLVDGYRVALAPTADFASPVFDYSYPMPFQHLVMDVTELTPCTTYYWKVAAFIGSDESDFSPVASFYFNPAGFCPLPPLPDSITGRVFHDLCALPDGPLPDPAPEGCVPTGDGSATANGILEYGEPGIPGVVVRLGDAPCPSINHGAVLTDEVGNFRFIEMDPGSYCISVEALDTNNVDILIPGGWTAPESGVGNTLATWEVTIAAGGEVTDVNFAWDYQFLPAYEGPGVISGLVWNDQCAYAEIGPVPDPLPEGCILDEWGRVTADALHDPEEPGIPGLVVDLGIGDCPTMGFMTATTDENGEYLFENVPAGHYCLRINAEDDVNSPILLPGRWTVMSSGHMGMTFRTVDVPAGGYILGQDFAWDYTLPHLYGYPPFYFVEVPTSCRLGPTEDYNIATYLEAGQAFPIIGRSLDEENWVYLLITDNAPGFPRSLLEEMYDPLDIPGDIVSMPGLERSTPVAPSEGVDYTYLVDANMASFLRCWASLNVGSEAGDLGPLAFVTPPRLVLPEPEEEPTPEPINCFAFTSRRSCVANPGCFWTQINDNIGVCHP